MRKTALALVPEPDDHRQQLAAYVARLKDMNDNELDGETAERLGLTAENMVRLAACAAEKAQRGHDVSSLRVGIFRYLPHIAGGSVSPELVVKFYNRPGPLGKLVRLPIEEQRRIARGDSFDYVVKPGEVRRFPIITLSAAQLQQVIGDGVIRSEGEQIIHLSKPAPPFTPRRVKLGKVTVDREDGGVVRIGKAKASAVDVISALTSAGMLS